MSKSTNNTHTQTNRPIVRLCLLKIDRFVICLRIICFFQRKKRKNRINYKLCEISKLSWNFLVSSAAHFAGCMHLSAVFQHLLLIIAMNPLFVINFCFKSAPTLISLLKQMVIANYCSIRIASTR